MPILEKPLSELLRPKTLAEFIGQGHLVGESGPINRLLRSGEVNSMIFWGPPGVGKTTLARIIAHELKANFNKAQQDYLLPHVEKGTLVLIGATTENPSFEVVSPLLSRTKVYVFNPVSKDEMRGMLARVFAYLKDRNIELSLPKDTLELLLESSNGDVRNLLNSIDTIVRVGINNADAETVKKVLQENFNRYDRTGEEHYNTISAFIKSMRASDVNAALYYLARMVNAGEDPLFIARRMVVFASEDIGMASPTALIVANEVFKACDTIGYPECQINLAHGTVYMCTSKKDRSAYNAYFMALDDVKRLGNLNIPLEIRNAPTKFMKDLGYGKGYEKYPNKANAYLPKELKDRKYYNPKRED